MNRFNTSIDKLLVTENNLGDDEYSSLDITPSINIQGIDYNYDIADVEKVNVPFTINVEARSWGIKGINVYPKPVTIPIKFVFNVWGDDEDEPRDIEVKLDLDRCKTYDIQSDAVTVAGITVELTSDMEVDYENTSIAFFKPGA